ncbi:hypothetical protein GGI20_005128 [Coemansia sp. BCRC 34301]|nr:hypothetical protein GGI20_005128 [Coemansia sp. BCRC 34301]
MTPVLLAAYVALLLLCPLVVARKSLDKIPRFQHSMEIFGGQLCVFGGKSTTTGVSLSDFLLDYRCVDVTKPIDQANPQWRRQSSASRFAMPPLAQQSSVYDRANHIIVPYGGQSPDTFSKANHLAVFCTQFQAWGASNIIDIDPRRYLHTAVLQQASGDMIIFGGASDATTNHQDSSRWLNVNRMVLDKPRHAAHTAALGVTDEGNITVGTIITDYGDKTPAAINMLGQHSSVLVNDTQMVVLGGNYYDEKLNKAVNILFDTVHVYDVDQMKWSTRNCSGHIPPDRSAFSASLHRSSIYIYGGVNVTGWSQLFGDLYKLDTITWKWSKLPTPDAPAPRYAHQMKTLGHYLVITHGFISTGKDTYSGDADIYFYDLDKQAFVSSYSPKGIAKSELDTQWIVKASHKTKGILAICYILTIVVVLFAVYYLGSECRKSRFASSAVRPRDRRGSGRGNIRTMVETYAENLRSSTYFFDSKRTDEQRRTSHDTDKVTLFSPTSTSRKSFAKGTATDGTSTGARNANGNSRGRSQSVSEGTSTVIDSEVTPPERRRSNHALPENMRHTRVIDNTANDTPYVSRKLTLSAHIPAYRARRGSEGPTVRFSEYTSDDVMNVSDDENVGYNGSTPSSISMDRQLEMSAIAEQREGVAENGDDNNDTSAGLRVINNE